MKRYIKSAEANSTIESPSAYLRANFPSYHKGMQVYDINGKSITTNLMAMEYPYWNGYSIARGFSENPKTIDWGTVDAIFDKLVDEGYTTIKFVGVPTSIRGLKKIYAFYK